MFQSLSEKKILEQSQAIMSRDFTWVTKILNPRKVWVGRDLNTPSVSSLPWTGAGQSQGVGTGHTYPLGVQTARRTEIT